MATQAPSELRALCNKLCPFKPTKGPHAIMPHFDPSQRSFSDMGMEIAYNQDIPMRDGIKLRADIFRPTSKPNDKLPIVLAITPYGKQNPFDVSSIPPSRDFNPGLDGVTFSKYAVFEGSDPAFWTKQDFAYVAVDSRGSFASEGEENLFLTKADGEDAYDVIEHLANLDWSNGCVGMIGASALGAIQWLAAGMRPPHLSGIVVQDAFTNMYSEVAFKGGVLHQNFVQLVDDMYCSHGNRVGTPKLDLSKGCELHPHFDEFWELFMADIANIECPVYAISSLADNGIHTAGTVRGWVAARSEMKFLELHPYLKWEWQLTPESLERQAAFFNHALCGANTHAAESTKYWPKVRLHVTEKHYAGSWRSEDSWPLSGTVRTRFDMGEDGILSARLPSSIIKSGSIQYDAHTGSASWTMRFYEPTEITGSAHLHLNFSISIGSDADIFVTLQKLDRDGNIVHFPYHTFINDGHVAYGWARASNCKLKQSQIGDEVAHTFRKEDSKPLTPNEVVEVDVNIQPSATLFRKNESLMLVVQGRDFGEYDPMGQIARAGMGVNRPGTHTIHLSGSWLEVPVITKET